VTVAWARAALRDVQRIYDFLLPLNPAAARRMAEAVLEAGDSLARFPDRGRAGRIPTTRELVAIRPYVLIDRVVADEVRILRVWHSAQDR
jgi:plasmid stabilization system protein ParE